MKVTFIIKIIILLLFFMFYSDNSFSVFFLSPPSFSMSQTNHHINLLKRPDLSDNPQNNINLLHAQIMLYFKWSNFPELDDNIVYFHTKNGVDSYSFQNYMANIIGNDLFTLKYMISNMVTSGDTTYPDKIANVCEKISEQFIFFFVSFANGNIQIKDLDHAGIASDPVEKSDIINIFSKRWSVENSNYLNNKFLLIAIANEIDLLFQLIQKNISILVKKRYIVDNSFIDESN